MYNNVKKNKSTVKRNTRQEVTTPQRGEDAKRTTAIEINMINIQMGCYENCEEWDAMHRAI